ncbi:hypothetical protein [Streptococcus gallinaceus]
MNYATEEVVSNLSPYATVNKDVKTQIADEKYYFLGNTCYTIIKYQTSVRGGEPTANTVQYTLTYDESTNKFSSLKSY